jgi:hypothetical protein
MKKSIVQAALNAAGGFGLDPQRQGRSFRSTRGVAGSGIVAISPVSLILGF